MSHPVLDCPKIHALPQMPGRKRRAEFVKPKVSWVQAGALGDVFQKLQEVGVRLAAGSREQEIAVPVGRPLPRFQRFDQLVWNWNFALLVRLRRPSPIGLVADADCTGFEVDVRPIGVHHFLIAHAGHQEKFVPHALFGIAGSEQSRLSVTDKTSSDIPTLTLLASLNPLRLQTV